MRVTGIEYSLYGKISVFAYQSSLPSSAQVAYTNVLTAAKKRRRSDGIVYCCFLIYFYKDWLCIKFIQALFLLCYIFVPHLQVLKDILQVSNQVQLLYVPYHLPLLKILLECLLTLPFLVSFLKSFCHHK